jgi:chemotaxis protein CheC
MASSPVLLTELELDALTELVNLGVSNAAGSLRDLVREEVVLSVPRVLVVTREQALANLSEREAKRLVAVRQDFEGDIRGRALLIFPEAKSMELVRGIIGSDLSAEDIMELEQEALAETGNIMLNSCLGTIANYFQRSLRISLPEVIYGEGDEFFGPASGGHANDRVVFMYINFAIRHRDIEGYIAMLLDLPSLATLKTLLAALIERTGGDPVIAPPHGV